MPRYSDFIKPILTRRGKDAFLKKIPQRGKVLDAGCGNNSPAWFKSRRPDIYYIGLDIEDYNQNADPLIKADEYILVRPEGFAQAIEQMRGQFDAVVSSQNLEHCLAPDAVLKALMASLKKGGKLYLSFPCEASVHFPRRRGSLNFRDDSTHQAAPPDFDAVRSTLEAGGFTINFASRRYRPLALFLAGLLLEPASFLLRRTMPGSATWALYGFESVIWATKGTTAR